MNSNLTVKNNVVVMILSAAIGAAIYVLSDPAPQVPMLVGGGFGVVVGLFQARSAAAAPRAFRRAVTAPDIRDALKMSSAGRISIALHWTAMLATIGAAIWIGRPVVGTLGGWAAYETLRRVGAMRGFILLSHPTESPGKAPTVPDPD